MEVYPTLARIQKRSRGRRMPGGPSEESFSQALIAAETAATAAYQARRNIRTGGFVGQELKFYDTHASGEIVNGTSLTNAYLLPSAGALNGPTTGDSASTRIGNRIEIQSTEVVGQVTFPHVTAEGSPPTLAPVTIALVLDKQCNKSAFTPNLVYKPNGSGSINQNCNLLRNLENSHRYQVLAKCTLMPEDFHVVAHKWSDTNGTSTVSEYANSSTITNFRLDSKKKILVNFSGTTEGVGSIVDNALFIFAISSDLSSGSVSATYDARIRYLG